MKRLRDVRRSRAKNNTSVRLCLQALAAVTHPRRPSFVANCEEQRTRGGADTNALRAVAHRNVARINASHLGSRMSSSSSAAFRPPHVAANSSSAAAASSRPTATKKRTTVAGTLICADGAAAGLDEWRLRYAPFHDVDE